MWILILGSMLLAVIVLTLGYLAWKFGLKRSGNFLALRNGALQLALDSIGDAVMYLDLEGNIQYVNRAAQDIYGYSPNELLGQPLSVLISGETASQAMYRQILDRSNCSGWRGVVNVVRKNREDVDVHLTARSVNDQKGSLIGSIVVSRDISESNRSTEKPKENIRLSSMEELAAGVAHEINNPLTSVIGFSQLLLTEDLPQHIKDDLGFVHSEANSAARIVKNLLSFARQSEPTKTNADISEILDRALEMKYYGFQVGNIKVVRQFASDVPRSMVDEPQLIQVILNILNNAEQAMGPAISGGCLVISTASDGERIKISISDDGPGIPVEQLSRIFEPFYTTKPVGKGTGLGLSISYRIVDQHRGKIWADSAPGHGATFHIELPVTSRDADHPTLAAPGPRNLLSKQVRF